MTDPQRYPAIDCLRLIAGLSMVALHATADPQGLPWPDHPPEARAAPLYLRAVLYTARTELFLIIALFLLLLAGERRPRSYRATVAEQARRLLLPFLVWTGFYALYGLIKAQAFGYLGPALAELANPVAWLRYLLLGGVKYHMHFLPTLFVLILAYPLYRLAQRQPALGLAIGLCLAVRHWLDALIYANFWGSDALPFLIRSVKLLTYTGYGMLAGAALGLWQRGALTARRWLAPLILLGVLLFTFKLDATQQSIATGAWAFDHAPGYWADFLFPALLFLACMSLGQGHWPNAVTRYARYAFGIYLCHPIFLDLCEILLRDSTLTPIAQITMKVLPTLAGTLILVPFLARRPALAWTVGLGPLPQLRPSRATAAKEQSC